MARFELNIYGKDDEIIKQYETDHVRWGIFLEAVKLQEELKGKNEIESIGSYSQFLKKIFIGLTDEEIENADSFDIVNTFNQLLSALNSFNTKKAKN